MTDPLRAAAEWLVTIHADDIAIEQGSALWEDLQRLRKALAEAQPGLDAEMLACAMEQFYGKAEGTMLDSAAAIAAEYIRLTEDRP